MIGTLYIAATGLILVGFALLCQPFSVGLYTSGFPVLLVGVILHIVLDHVPRRPSASETDAKSSTGR